MIYLVGPTSSGKTSLALKICKKFNKEIISADSRQIYKHFDIGTGKVPINSREVSIEKHSDYWVIDGVKIHMYDVCDANFNYSVADFLKDTKNLIEEDKIIVGGTGLYIDNLLGLKKPSPVPPNLKLRVALEAKSLEELQSMLSKEILDAMNQSDINNKRRLMRKIEIQGHQSTDPSIKDKIDIKDFGLVNLAKDPMVVILDIPREELFKRVDDWVDSIWMPLLSEVEMLISLGYKDSFPMQGLIYKTVLDFFIKKITESEAVWVIKNDLHAYIRRQRTWFNKYNQPYIHRFNSNDRAFSYIESILAN